MTERRGVAIVRAIYDAINAGDPDVFGLLDPAIEWITPPSLPWGVAGRDGVYRGHAELVTYFGSFVAQVSDGQVDIDDLLPMGDRVLAVGWERGTARATGHAFHARCAHLWTIEGERAVRLDGFPDSAAMHAAFASTASPTGST